MSDVQGWYAYKHERGAREEIHRIQENRMTWDELESEAKILVAKITDPPDLVIGIARGGVIPAVLLSNLLNVKDLLVLKVRKEGDGRKVVAEVVADVTNKKVLLVEDMLETGQSLIVTKAYLESKGASVKTVCLYTMPITEIQPDFFIREVQEVQKFPWE